MTERYVRYEISGSTVRKTYAEPKRRPEERPARTPEIRVEKRLRNHTDRALAFNKGYMVFVLFCVTIMLGACVYMISSELSLNEQKAHIQELEQSISALETDNEAKRIMLDNMYTLDNIRDIAVNELGMVYAKKGQIIYFDSADEDYVKQYMDVPEAK